MRILVTGAGGMLARDFTARAAERGHEVLPFDRAELDVTDTTRLSRTIETAAPDAVFMGAAFTDVNGAEDAEPLAHRINALAAGVAAEACHHAGAVFVYPSTDYVFDGRAGRPYLPTDPPAPLNAYGRSKLAGEQAALAACRSLIVRTGWLYGVGGRNFVETMLRLGAEREEVEVVADQTGRPTWTADLATGIVLLLEREASGVFHLTAEGPPVSWAGFAERILEEARMGARVVPIFSAARADPAARPAYSVLDTSAAASLIGHGLADWRDALAAYIAARHG